MVKSTGNGYTISLCNVLCSFVCFIFTLWIHVWWAASSSWMPVYSCDHLSPLQADNQSCTAANVTPLHLWTFFFSPHRISGDRLCCVHLLDGWKKVFRSPEKKKIKYHCYLTAVISHNAPLYITLRITAINQCEFAFVVLSYLKLLIPQCGICVLCFNLMASAGNKSCCFTGTLAFLSR